MICGLCMICEGLGRMGSGICEVGDEDCEFVNVFEG